MGGKILGRFTVFPKNLFRISAGRSTRLRDRALRPTASSWDVLTVDGVVQPLGATSDWYQQPNGASLRPNTRTQQSLVCNFRAPTVVIYHVSKGTKLPDDLLLIHERGEHYSLQPTHAMLLEELDQKITSFLNDKANCMSREEWHVQFPTSTE